MLFDQSAKEILGINLKENKRCRDIYNAFKDFISLIKFLRLSLDNSKTSISQLVVKYKKVCEHFI